MDNAVQDLPFLKMHGAGNDFVVIDARRGVRAPTAAEVRAIGDRHRGVGFDQLAVIGPGQEADADLTFWNADGSLSDACGNATRCVASLLMDEAGAERIALRTGRGVLEGVRDAGVVSVNMGPPVLNWREIPLAEDVDLDALPIEGAPSAVGMGNPHCVFFVEDAAAVDLPTFGPTIEHHPLYPQRTNVEIVQVLDRQTLRQRTWERGAGETLACGSGACAVAVAASRRGLAERRVSIRLDGGTLGLDWRDDGVWMSGPVAHVFSGTFTASFLEGAV
ncbi:diaminopimelate epimerase [Pontivivens ytuae]|uniref:Diaminopimelate epimerase n=1 Tax=Pontivivens ytuae TaxID=2789856 RepID=A0A7S9LW58_9RHOB|nr:diaminopimelate epimerase [Pontivivens ytuae]QPH56276.1 diaminopimelate epimerase [Pontivivens ytuae]